MPGEVTIEDTYLYDLLLGAYMEGWDANMHSLHEITLEDSWEHSATRRDIHKIAHALVDGSGWPLLPSEASS